MVKYVKMIGIILLIGAVGLPSVILGEPDSVSMVIHGSEPFNPKGKFGFQLIFTDLKLSSHTQELGISYYLTPTWETNIQLLADLKSQKEVIKKYYSDDNYLTYKNYVSDTLSIHNSFRITLGIKKHSLIKSDISIYFGLLCSMELPWNYREETDQNIGKASNRIYEKQMNLGCPIGIEYWINKNFSVSCDQAFGASYTRYSVFNTRYSDIDFKTWKYGLLDFHFMVIVHY